MCSVAQSLGSVITQFDFAVMIPGEVDSDARPGGVVKPLFQIGLVSFHSLGPWYCESQYVYLCSYELHAKCAYRP
jgi:hypothetical protein